MSSPLRNKLIKIEGVVLTADSIDLIKKLQTDDNKLIQSICDDLNEATTLIAKNIANISTINDATSAILNLSIIRDQINKLSKP